METVTPAEAIANAQAEIKARRESGQASGERDLPGGREYTAGAGPDDDAGTLVESGEAGTEVKALKDGGDPGDYTVPEVVAHLNGLADDDAGRAEFDRVVAAEQSGKNRAGIVGGA